MKKKFLALVLSALVILFSGCESPAPANESEATSEPNVSSEAMSFDDVSTEVTASSETKASDEKSSALSEESSEENKEIDDNKSELKYAEFKLADGLSTTYADMENRSFVYNGKKFILGQSTLQDLIDADFPFNKNELNNVNNNLNKNRETSPYTVDITDLTHMQLNFLNMTDDSISEKEAVLSTVRWYATYTPHDDYDENLNKQIFENINECSEQISFSFPLWLQKKELLANSPNPTKEDDYGHVKYNMDSEVYMGESGYEFEFDTTTEQLKNVYITWLP